MNGDRAPIGLGGCLNERLELATRHVREGEWASGHAIARGLLRCANSSGCRCRDECHCAAMSLLGDIMHSVAA